MGGRELYRPIEETVHCLASCPAAPAYGARTLAFAGDKEFTMATRSGRSTSSDASDGATDGTEASASPQAAADVARQQLVVATQSMATLFRNIERFQLAQQHFAQRAALLHSQAADNLRKATTPMELVSIQGTLFMYQWQEGARYLQEMMVAGASIGSREGSAPPDDGVLGSPASAAQAATTAAMNAAAPMVQAWQQMFTPPQEGERPH
jgi:hypothetical protein